MKGYINYGRLKDAEIMLQGHKIVGRCNESRCRSMDYGRPIKPFSLKGLSSKPSGDCIVVPNFCFLS